MQIDPIAEWQRITEVYRSMYDDELLNLAADSQDLTDVAKQALDSELKKRGLGDLSNAHPVRQTPEPRRERRAALLGNQGGAPQLVLEYHNNPQDHEFPIEYTWKTVLCECDTMEQAHQLSKVLNLAGIDNWIEDPNVVSQYKGGFKLAHPRVLVAADQLEQARAVANNPIPKEIIDESNAPSPEFVMPACPHCGAKNPALEGVDQFNSWRCESCGYQWAESEGDLSADTPT